MKPTKANLECADLILERNRLPRYAWPDLRRDIALAMDIAEREALESQQPKARPDASGSTQENLGGCND